MLIFTKERSKMEDVFRLSFKEDGMQKKTSFSHVMQLVDAEESVTQKESRIS